MEFEEQQPLNALEACETEANNEEIVALIQKVHSALGSTKMDRIVVDLEDILKQTLLDQYNEKAPYYCFLLAYAFNSFGRNDESIRYIQRAESQFSMMVKKKQQAISVWLLGLLFYKQGILDNAKVEIDKAVKIISKLCDEQRELGLYNNEYNDLLKEIKASYKFISPLDYQRRKSSAVNMFKNLKINSSSVPEPTKIKYKSINTKRLLHVFLCHSSNDKPIVRELYQKLCAETWIQPWLDEEELYPGQDWNIEIEKAIEETDVIIVCLSKSSITKEGYVQKEIRVALDYADYKPEGTLFIIPVRLEECTPPKRLGRWQYADYFEGQRDRALRRLLVSLKRRADSLGEK